MQADAPQIPVDPNLDAEQQQAQNSLVSNLQVQAQGDTAAMMSRYGARLALGSTGTAPTTPAAPAAPAVRF